MRIHAKRLHASKHAVRSIDTCKGGRKNLPDHACHPVQMHQKNSSLLALPKEGKAIGRNKEKRRVSGNKQKTERFGEWTACCGNQEHLRVGLVEVMRMRNEWNNLKGR